MEVRDESEGRVLVDRAGPGPPVRHGERRRQALHRNDGRVRQTRRAH
ncbi:hypothetical protein HEB94_005130 [Actinopolymorpha pittospori]|uniref:Uncharacterized protein n=1 Tax=Actinopolymorpha pittospori TaxID=648752 RepID=A0A927R9V6_9ACTN|nr:hypothetical protein [Actinopolymorpha pittospori]